MKAVTDSSKLPVGSEVEARAPIEPPRPVAFAVALAAPAAPFVEAAPATPPVAVACASASFDPLIVMLAVAAPPAVAVPPWLPPPAPPLAIAVPETTALLWSFTVRVETAFPAAPAAPPKL